MDINGKDIKLITAHLQDDISKTIFANRLGYVLTAENGYLRNICTTIPEGREFASVLSAHSEQEKILFGAGQWGKWIAETYDNIDWEYMVDNNIRGRSDINIPFISVCELIEKHRDAFVVITSKYYWNEMQKQLLEAGFKQEQLFLFGKIISEIEERIYFDLPVLPHLQHEIFIDGGGMMECQQLIFASGQQEIGILRYLSPKRSYRRNAEVMWQI